MIIKISAATVDNLDESAASIKPEDIIQDLRNVSDILQNKEDEDTDIFDLIFANTTDEEKLKKSDEEIVEARDHYLGMQKQFLDSTIAYTQANAFGKTHTDPEFSKHIEGFRGTNYIPQAALNYNLPWRKKTEHSDLKIKSFIKDSEPEKYRFDKQVRHNNSMHDSSYKDIWLHGIMIIKDFCLIILHSRVRNRALDKCNDEGRTRTFSAI